MTVPASPSRNKPALLALVVGGLLSMFVSGSLHDWETHEAREQVQQVAQVRADLLRSEIMRSTEVLHAIAALFDARGGVSREEFGRFVAGALSRQPELQGLAWVPRVAGDERGVWEQRARDEGFPNFQFTEEKDDSTLVPAETREVHFPVFYLESLQKNDAAFGFDVYSESRRRRALQQARDSGQVTATVPLHLAHEQGGQRGFLVFEPLYEGTPTTRAERRAQLQGFAVAAFRIDNLLSSAWRAAEDQGLATTISDTTDREVIYQQKTPYREPYWDTVLDVAGRHWILHFTPTAGFRGDALSWQSDAALMVGLLITAMVAAFLWKGPRRWVEVAESDATREPEVAEPADGEMVELSAEKYGVVGKR